MSTATRKRKQTIASLAVASLLLSGCAAAGSTGPGSPSTPASESPSAKQSAKHHPGTPEAASAIPATSTAGGPSEATKMICGQETKDDISSILDLKAAPHTVDTWAERIYTCTYHLADGPLVISVRESPDLAGARKYFDSLQDRLYGATPIKGLANLGFAAVQTDDGSVVFLKDTSTLYVDATQLPASVGPQKVARTDFAYQVSTTILACWKEHH